MLTTSFTCIQSEYTLYAHETNKLKFLYSNVLDTKVLQKYKVYVITKINFYLFLSLTNIILKDHSGYSTMNNPTIIPSTDINCPWFILIHFKTFNALPTIHLIHNIRKTSVSFHSLRGFSTPFSLFLDFLHHTFP